MAKDAVKFEDTISKLARHVGTRKMMSTLVTLEFEEPAVPTREYCADPGHRIKTNERTRPGTRDTVVDNPSVKEDWEHNLSRGRGVQGQAQGLQ